MIIEEVHTLAEQMVARVTTIDAVVAVGIYQLTEVFVGSYEGIDIGSRILKVHIVVGQPVTKQQGATELRGTS